MTETTEGCNFAGCEKQLRAKGYCSAHYQQNRNGLPLTPIRRYNKTNPDDYGKTCNGCKTYKSHDDYYGSARSHCKDCYIKNVLARKEARRQSV